MKFVIAVLLLVALAMVSVDAYESPVQKPNPKGPKFPTFPGQGSFNPRPGRYPRSPKEKNGQIKVDAKKEGGKTSWNVDAQQKIWGNKHGSINVNAGANKQPGGKPQGQVGISGSFQWG
ncbi:APC membrane recruitment protein 3-like isoform X2 [Phymastichus coffea]|nr:APC membrane recruitment protein 3-like isoform X2 [Phymastichus coffea]XP_058795309.1 APC membrane recruitment protein 3-like isoform X2 [Phymastichus coffea]XP_058795310.1 APC membrane recruitment protein 3-like isoform X2 [Phymastichus coffea]XP_058795311.1 APC membrane recruitment protein 3-like isoform X2 [Phymastichus coffea]